MYQLGFDNLFLFIGEPTASTLGDTCTRFFFNFHQIHYKKILFIVFLSKFGLQIMRRLMCLDFLTFYHRT